MAQTPVSIEDIRSAVESLQGSVGRLVRVLELAESRNVREVYLHWTGFSGKAVPAVRNMSIDAEKAVEDAADALRHGRPTKAEQEIRKAVRQGDRKSSPRKKLPKG